MNKKVLLVDDNYICVEGIQYALPWDSLGISEVNASYDGASALSFLRAHPVDILVSDISMPGMSGLELSEQALALNPSIKIILISAYDEFEYARQAVRLGAYDYIEKPINYSYLTEILRKVLADIDQEQKNLEILKKSRPAMEEQFFRSLIRPGGKEERQTLKLYADYLGLELSPRFSRVLQISVEDSSSLKQKLGIQEYYVRFMSLENRIQAACASFPFHYVLKDLESFVCIAGGNFPSRKEFHKATIDSFQEIIDLFGTRFDLSIGLGSVVNNIWELPSSYTAAGQALEYRFFFPEQHFLEAGAISRYGSEILLGNEIPEEDLIQAISKNDMDGVASWIEEFIHSFPGNCDSRIVVYSRLCSVIARLLKFSYELNIMTPDFEKELTSVFSDPGKFRTIDRIAEWLRSVCETICGRLQDSVAKYHEGLCAAAVNYIMKNYGDSALSLNEIAESLQISSSYLSTLFKQCRNENISAFLTDTRIDAACQLLENTSLSLKSISAQVGYSNQYYFSSCFKKKTGVTPSAYREAHRGS